MLNFKLFLLIQNVILLYFLHIISIKSLGFRSGPNCTREQRLNSSFFTTPINITISLKTNPIKISIIHNYITYPQYLIYCSF